ncbi:AAA family ATPase [Rhodococcus sp. AQ5-07]|uniref:AAA family ATPase n=1 Tax=Rhodococcus sp. AQ5-07 TaxID=2054902 RepID=UPI000DBF6999|nr:AAA family ATPase [Rhodococcus sp. AQ5-07]RAL31166.1 hypothetical protein CVN56_29805 [Rhodococcus sp. AQ5-07]
MDYANFTTNTSDAGTGSGDTRREADLNSTETPMTDRSISDHTNAVSGENMENAAGEPEFTPIYITSSFDVPPSVQRVFDSVRAYATEMDRPLSLPQITGVDPECEIVNIEFETCPACRTEPLVIEHIGPQFGGTTGLACEGCAYDEIEPYKEFKINPNSLMDNYDVITEVNSEVTESVAKEMSVPFFTHPSDLVNAKAREMWIASESRKELERHYAEVDPSKNLPFDFGTLEEILQRPDEPADRIEGLMTTEGGTIIVAARKTGKTTFVLNLTHSLISGDPFLGKFKTIPIAEDAKVALMNYEVSAKQAARWANDVGIDPKRFLIINLRGRRNPLGNAADQARLAKLLRDNKVESLIVDPFGRAFTGANQNDPSEVGTWLVNLDHFAREQAGVRDVILPVHAGWNQDRTRGASSIEDWADSIINLTTDPEGRRFVRAMGRDIELDEDQLLFDTATRRLSLSGLGGRAAEAADKKAAKRDDRAATLLPYLVEGIRRHPGSGIGDLTSWLQSIRIGGKKFDFRSEEMTHASLLAQERGLVRIEMGTRNKKHHHITDAAEGITVWPALPEDPATTT